MFDHAWADAWQRAGLCYFPKLVSAIPYTPASGQRMLCRQNRQEELFPILLNAVIKLVQAEDFSGVHILFSDAEQQTFLAQKPLICRHDCQYHWHNREYHNFDDFLSRLTARKRKNIRRERQKVAQVGIQLRCLDGHSASEKDWQDFTNFYNQTFAEKNGMATFNLGFFQQVATALPDHVLLVLANDGDDCIAGALMYKSDSTLFGRHWGSVEHFDSLHFEACYYQGIEHCIASGLAHFEPGAQGEHKIARGFEPTLTRSFHWVKDEQFRHSLKHYCEHEQTAVQAYMEELAGSSPFRVERMSDG